MTRSQVPWKHLWRGNWRSCINDNSFIPRLTFDTGEEQWFSPHDEDDMFQSLNGRCDHCCNTTHLNTIFGAKTVYSLSTVDARGCHSTSFEFWEKRWSNEDIGDTRYYFNWYYQEFIIYRRESFYTTLTRSLQVMQWFYMGYIESWILSPFYILWTLASIDGIYLLYPKSTVIDCIHCQQITCDMS